MFHLRKLFSISIKLCRQPVIQTIINRHQLFCTTAIKVSTDSINKEHAFAHAVLEVNPKCLVLRGEQNEKNVDESAVIDFDQKWESLTTDGIVESLETVRNYCKQNGTTISDRRFDKFVDVCTERSVDFTDDQLMQSLQILARYPLTESPKSRNFFELWNAFDDACVERINIWDVNKVLYVCDHWHMLRLGRLNKFNYRGGLKIGKKLRQLLPHQLVQLTFYLSIKRIEKLDMLDIEINFEKSLDDFSVDEIAVVCMGFFKAQTKFKTPNLVEKIYKRTMREIDTVESIALSCILKVLRYSCNNSHSVLVREMLNAANSQMSRISRLTCLDAAMLGTHLDICHQSLIEQMLPRFSDDVKSIHMKNIERISQVMGVLDFESESNIEGRLCQQILAELKNRVDEIVQYPRCFALSLYYLTLKGYCDEEMISVALSKPFLDSAYGNQIHYGPELFALDSYAKINLKQTYTGNELTERARRYLGKMMTEYIPDRGNKFKYNFNDIILLELKETSDELWTHSHLAHALPHFRKADVIIAYDKNSNTGIDIAHNLPPHYTGTITDRSMLVEGLNIDAANVEIVNIIVGGWSNYVRDTQKMNGFTRQKVEQSKILGLRPVLIWFLEWKNLQPGERKPYVELKINEALREK